MAKANATVKVVLHAPGSSENFHFESTDLPIGKDNVIYFSNCGTKKGFLISYEIDDSDNPGFRFPTKQSHGDNYLKEALWATTTGGCPTSAVYWDEVFKAVDVKDQGKTLVVSNENRVSQMFAYTLWAFNGSAKLELDPSGSNQNGGLPLYQSALVTSATGAIAAASAAMLANQELTPVSGLTFAIGGALLGLVIGLVANRA